ncbi:Bug family tripartite tricarboxylate transporter substrate binding protein [Curvibacter gracilis]|uniref:Bug family tripartite tricarboxylate transporter substrate binding protein n=1 Tax=Curvibacter gracilis TaxID=230310 RepID=UPI00146F9A8F|nr:tripartite tricarboxylate transporter substrate binding protein [Curvibacter gracilis]
MLLSSAGLAWAQHWPDKPIRFVVGGPAGGGVDLAARVLAERLSAQFGQQVIVDNKPGAAGLIGAADLLKSPRDGSTFMVQVNAIVSEIPHAVKMPFDPLKALKPLAELSRLGLVFSTNSQVPANTLSEFITYAKANKGKVNFASYSAGTLSHTLGLALNKQAGLDMVHVAYKGSPPALQDLMGGQVQASFDVAGNVEPHVKAGRIKVLATTAPQRLPMFPEVPTFAELGYKDLTEVIWIGLWTTPDLPAPIQQKMRDATLKALQDPKLREAYAKMGWSIGGHATPDELMSSLRAASDKQGAVLQSIGFKPE